MKKLFVLFFLALTLQASAQKAKEVPYRTIRTLTADLNNDGRIDTIKLISSFRDWNSFNRISISLTGYGKRVFNARDYWTVVDSEFLASNKNAIHTKLLFLKSTAVHSVILLFGQDGEANYRSEFSIINIENNKVTMAFDQIDGDKLITAIALLDTPLTKTYNEKHYVYAGLEFGKEIKIFYPNNGGKPKVWKEKAQK
jgi:hypothetical protein